MDNRFTLAPQIKQNRSKFMRNSQYKTTFNTGDLVPIMVDEVLPGDTFNMTMTSLVRTTTPIVPVMDNAFLDTYAFFVPNRLVWDNWEEFMGENKSGQWADKHKHLIPQIKVGAGKSWKGGSLADHFGLPTNTSNLSVSHLPFRGYALIHNEFFRDQNVQDSALIDKSAKDRTSDLVNGAKTTPSQGDSYKNTNLENWYEKALAGQEMLKVNKYHDYFTSCLPTAQKGDDVALPLYASDSLGEIPVAVGGDHDKKTFANLFGSVPMRFKKEDDTALSFIGGDFPLIARSKSTQNTEAELTYKKASDTASISDKGLKPVNLWALMREGTPKNINDLRRAFQMQKAIERDARSGTRYTEMVEAHFGVSNPDSRLQRPEFLGGQHIPLTQTQVAQTSGTVNADDTKTGAKAKQDTPQGHLAAYSLTTGSDQLAFKSFTEHGYVFILACVRTEHSYQNNIEKMWSRQERFDFYHPVFANIGEQPVLNKEILATGTSVDKNVFGFQEAWADYRMKPNKITGKFKSNDPQNLSFWHYADDYGTATPTLNDIWMLEKPNNMDRTLAIESSATDQIIADFYVQNECTRTMPLYSVPGLIDHN